MDFTPDYSGIIAIFVYLCILTLVLKFRKPRVEEATEEETPVVTETKEIAPLDLNDEDATVACLVAAIECRNEAHSNVQIVSVRRIS